MNIYSAKQLLQNNGWQFTITNELGISPVGYCDINGHKHLDNPGKNSDNFIHKYHSTPHLTEEGAINCWKDYLKDHPEFKFKMTLI